MYIEIDGGLRPHIIQDKIRFNKNIKRNLLVINTKDLRKLDYSRIAQLAEQQAVNLEVVGAEPTLGAIK